LEAKRGLPHELAELLISLPGLLAELLISLPGLLAELLISLPGLFEELLMPARALVSLSADQVSEAFASAEHETYCLRSQPTSCAEDVEEGPLKPDQVVRGDLPGDAPEVDQQGRAGDDLLEVELGVGRDDRHQVSLLEALVERGREEAELGQLGDVGVVIEHI